MGSMTSLAGSTALVSGATSGIGFETALGLARRGAHVVLGARSRSRGQRAVQAIAESVRGARAEFVLGDLSSLSEVRRFAHDFREQYARLDILVNNVGGLFLGRQTSAEGLEMTFALNHLSYFLLTELLQPMLIESAPARIVNVSSEAHRNASINFDDLNLTRRYFGWTAYGQSKLANVLFTYELARRLEGSGVTANALHPGFVRTGLGTKNTSPLLRILVWLIFRMGMSPRQGAQTSLLLAASPEVEGVSGEYYSVERRVRSSRRSYDEAAAQRLWDISQELVAVR